jgi:hypothetical protein
MDRDPFEFSPHLRQLTETNVEQARAACAQFVDAMTQAMDLWLNAMPQNEMTAGLKVLQGQAIRFGKRNMEAGLNLASDLANATSFRDMLDVQTTYAQTQLHILKYQTQELARLLAKVGGGWNLQPKR